MNPMRVSLIGRGVLPDTDGWRQLQSATRVDLTGGSSQFYLALLPQQQSGFRILEAVADASTLIAYCQDGARRLLSAAEQRFVGQDITGKYDCQTAANVGALARALGLDATASGTHLRPLGLREFAILLVGSGLLQSQLRDVFGTTQEPVDGAMIVYPADAGAFVAADVPTGCEPA